MACHSAEPNLIQDYPQLLRLEEAFWQMLQARVVSTPEDEANGAGQDAAEALKTLVVAWVRHLGLPLLAWYCKNCDA